MSKFLNDIKHEVEVRIRAYTNEKEQLAKAAARVLELDGMIAEAKEELASIEARLPQPEEAKEETKK